MIRRSIISLILACLCTLNSLAQSDLDILRYSTFNPLGSTARSMGIGGAIGALGADPSVQLSNPAGLAQYRSGVFTIGFDMQMAGLQADYMDQIYNSTMGKVTIPNFNIILTHVNTIKGNPVQKGWINYSFGIGLNKTADYSRKMSFAGLNRENSILDYMAQYVQGLPASALDANDEQLDYGFYYFENMFWYAYLIDSISDGNYYPYYNSDNPMQYQSGYLNSKGGMNEINFSFAANYSHKVFFGLALNLHTLRYGETNRFSETDNPATLENWSSFDFTRHLSTSGYGMSGRLGLLIKPNDNFRLGLSVTTPTFLELTDEYYDELFVVYDNGGSEDIRTIDKQFTYMVNTPARLGIQGAYIFGKRGLLSAEIEQVNYSTMSISSETYGFESENQRIANKYQSATNLKVGGELAFDAFRIRAGYANLSSPFTGNSHTYRQHFLTAGFGIHEQSMSFDLAVIKQLGEEVYYPYTINEISSGPVKSSLNSTKIALTLAFKL